MEVTRHQNIERNGDTVRYNFIVYGHVSVYYDIDINTGEYIRGTFNTDSKQHAILAEYVAKEFEYIQTLKQLIAEEENNQ